MIFQLLYAILVWLVMYFPGFDILASVIFLYILFQWSRRLGADGLSTPQAIGTAVLAQMPGLVFGALALHSWWLYGPLTSNNDFALQMWHTPLVPLLSLLPVVYVREFPLTYLILFFLSPLYILLMVLIARLFRAEDTRGYRARGDRPF
jgi:hypothetical protein